MDMKNEVRIGIDALKGNDRRGFWGRLKGLLNEVKFKRFHRQGIKAITVDGHSVGQLGVTDDQIIALSRLVATGKHRETR